MNRDAGPAAHLDQELPPARRLTVAIALSQLGGVDQSTIMRCSWADIRTTWVSEAISASGSPPQTIMPARSASRCNPLPPLRIVVMRAETVGAVRPPIASRPYRGHPVRGKLHAGSSP